MKKPKKKPKVGVKVSSGQIHGIVGAGSADPTVGTEVSGGQIQGIIGAGSADPKVGMEVSGGQIQGIVGAGSVVIENLTLYSGAPEEPAQSADAEPIGPCPYPGLAHFGPSDADHFFGRDAAITTLAEAVGRQSFTALVGASGSGKSSVVLAGLVPRLHSDRAG